jgi:hypothetical protein
VVADGRSISREQFSRFFALCAAATFYASPKNGSFAIGLFTVIALLLVWLFADRKTKVRLGKIKLQATLEQPRRRAQRRQGVKECASHCRCQTGGIRGGRRCHGRTRQQLRLDVVGPSLADELFGRLALAFEPELILVAPKG